MDDHMKIYLELLSKMSDEQFEAHKSIIEEIHSSGGVLSQDEQFNLALKMLIILRKAMRGCIEIF